MKKGYIVKIKIPVKLYESYLKYLLNNTNGYDYIGEYVYGLYAWTFDKKIIEEFREARCYEDNDSIYKIEKHDVDDEFERLLRSSYEQSELKHHIYLFNKYKYYDTPVKDLPIDSYATVVSTINEYYNSASDGETNIIDFILPNIINLDYKIFNDSIIDALDKVGYVREWIFHYGSDDERDVAAFQESYGLTIIGNSTKDLKYGNNEFNTLLWIYRYMFCGFDYRYEI